MDHPLSSAEERIPISPTVTEIYRNPGFGKYKNRHFWTLEFFIKSAMNDMSPSHLFLDSTHQDLSNGVFRVSIRRVVVEI